MLGYGNEGTGVYPPGYYMLLDYVIFFFYHLVDVRAELSRRLLTNLDLQGSQDGLHGRLVCENYFSGP